MRNRDGPRQAGTTPKIRAVTKETIKVKARTEPSGRTLSDTGEDDCDVSVTAEWPAQKASSKPKTPPPMASSAPSAFLERRVRKPIIEAFQLHQLLRVWNRQHSEQGRINQGENRGIRAYSECQP